MFLFPKSNNFLLRYLLHYFPWTSVQLNTSDTACIYVMYVATRQLKVVFR